MQTSINNHYISSGRFNPLTTSLAFAIAIPLAFLTGNFYGFLSRICPFIILDFLILALIIAMTGIIAIGVVRIGTVRNKLIKFIVSLVITLVSWYGSWAYLAYHNWNGHWYELFGKAANLERTFSRIAEYLNEHAFTIGRFTSSSGLEVSGIGMWIFALLEFLIFGLTILLVYSASKDYYCERCGKFNEEKEFYMEDCDETVFTAHEQTGQFSGLTQVSARKKLRRADEITDYTKPVYEVHLSWCPTCLKNGVLNVKQGLYHKDNKDSISFNDKKKLLKDVLIDDGAMHALLEHKGWD